MPRLMSVHFTQAAVEERRKTVTRRKGWGFLQPGDRLTLCRKVRGRKPGEPLDRITDVEVVSVRREMLGLLLTPGLLLVDGEWVTGYGAREVSLEGFPGMTPASFIHEFFVTPQKISATDTITRIEWRYL